HKGRLLSTLLAVALGVAFVAGVLMLSDTMNKSFDDLFATAYEGTDAVVRSEGTIHDGMGGELRSRLDASLLNEVREVDGVAAADGSVEGYARIIDQNGDPVGDPAMGPPTFGGNWTEVDELNGFSISDGRAPEAADEVVIDAGSAKDTDYQVGNSVPVQTKEGAEDFELVGIARFGNADSPGGATYALWTTEEAQRLVGERGKFDGIGVVAEDGVSQTEVADAIEQQLTDDGETGLEVLTGEAITEESQSDLKEQLSFFTTFLLTFAIIAVFVGTFVIYNSFSIIVAQRTRQIALMRAVGASRRQVRRSVFFEALAIGIVGSILGFLLGLGVATVLVNLFDLPGDLVVGPTVVLIALVVGVLVTLVSALIPAWRASRVAPVAAMRDVAIDTAGRSRVRFIAGLVATLLGVVLVVTGANGRTVSTVGIGVGLAFLGLLLLGPGLAAPMSHLVGAPLGRFRGVTGALAKENAGRNPKRTSATAQALMIGVGLVSFFLVVNASVRASIDKVLDDSFNGDFVIDSGTFGVVGLPPEVAQRVGELPDVADAVPLRFTPARIAGDDTQVTGTTAGAFGVLSLDLSSGSSELGPGEVVLTEAEADDLGLSLGDPLAVDFVNTGSHTYTVGGIYAEGDAGTNIGDVVLGLDDYTAAVPDSTDNTVFVELASGVSIDEARPEIERVVEPFATAEVQSVDEYKDAIGGQLDTLLSLMLGLLGLALIIALIGIANTIALSVLERTRELGLLRAVGMSRSQLRATVRWESVIIAVFGTLLGLAVGLLGGWGLVTALGDEGFEVFEIPYGTLIIVVLIAAAAGIFAAVWPAWRASRMDVLDAINTE
ncbi:MAG: ABC transporter permease, partial [Acidimicrobiales bacterium]